MTTGVVQLPLKMQAYFADGEIAAKIDGEPVPLTFEGPRRLGGFRSHFEKRGLNANDRVRFELEVAGESVACLTASCIKRERNKPLDSLRRGQEADSGTIASDKQAPGMKSTTEASAGETAARGDQASGWPRDSAVRAVRRVTIKGSDTGSSFDATATAASQQSGGEPRTSGHAPVSKVRWQPLDGLSPAGEPSSERDVEYSDTTVRAIRRRGALAISETPENPDTPSTTQPEFEVSASPPSRVEHGTPAGGPVRLADLVAPAESSAEHMVRRPAPLRPRIFVGRGPRAEREATAFAELTASAPEPSANGKGKGSPDLIEERELVPVTRHAERPHIMATATTPWGRSAPQKVPATRSDPPTPTASWTSGADNRPAVIDDADFSGYDDLRGEQHSDARRAQSNRTPGETAGPAATAGNHAAGVVGNHESKASEPTADPVSPSISAVTTAELSAAAPTSLEDDVKEVSAQLDRPETPAIVRSDMLAEQLGLEAERCERALERLADNRDRITRIRKGAYMIRRDATRP